MRSSTSDLHFSVASVFFFAVDLGLVKGLLHTSEILWDKEEKLEEKFEVGDEIEVIIKSSLLTTPLLIQLLIAMPTPFWLL